MEKEVIKFIVKLLKEHSITIYPNKKCNIWEGRKIESGKLIGISRDGKAIRVITGITGNTVESYAPYFWKINKD